MMADKIRERAKRSGLELADETVGKLAAHANAILRNNDELHLTTITDPDEFVERHIGEAFEGAAMLDPTVEGTMLDLGSGNGYPGIPLAAARPGLRLTLTDASARKAEFLRQTVRSCNLDWVDVYEAQIQRASDAEHLGPLRVLTVRAMGGWAKILPRMVAALAPEGEMLIWCGEELERVATRTAWKRLELQNRKLLPDRERSWIWSFRTR